MFNTLTFFLYPFACPLPTPSFVYILHKPPFPSIPSFNQTFFSLPNTFLSPCLPPSINHSSCCFSLSFFYPFPPSFLFSPLPFFPFLYSLLPISRLFLNNSFFILSFFQFESSLPGPFFCNPSGSSPLILFSHSFSPYLYPLVCSSPSFPPVFQSSPFTQHPTQHKDSFSGVFPEAPVYCVIRRFMCVMLSQRSASYLIPRSANLTWRESALEINTREKKCCLSS